MSRAINMMDKRLHTNLAGIYMNTPVLTASGTFGFGEEFAEFVDLSRLGGVMVKGTTLKPNAPCSLAAAWAYPRCFFTPNMHRARPMC